MQPLPQDAADLGYLPLFIQREFEHPLNEDKRCLSDEKQRPSVTLLFVCACPFAEGFLCTVKRVFQ